MIAELSRFFVSVLRRAWGWIARFTPDPVALPSQRRSPELEELFRAAAVLRAEDGLIPMSALRRLSAEDRAAVQGLSQAEAKRMIRSWMSGGDATATGAEVTEPYRRPR